MTGLVRRATLFTGLGLLAAGAAFAGVPNLGQSTVGNSLLLGGQSGGVVDSRVEKNITIRDAAGNVVPNSVVTINLTTCTAGDIRLCSTQPFAGTFINCAAKTVSKVTSAGGVATFRIVGGATNNGGNPAGVGVGCATVSADGVPLGNMTVGTPDENGGLGGLGGVDVLDTGAFFGDRFGAYRGRSDMNGDGAVDVLDTATFFNVRFGAGSVSGCVGGNCL